MIVGRLAPDFTEPALLPDGSFQESFHMHQEIDGHYGLLFFYPLNFTFVCPTELVALHQQMQALSQRGVKVMAISVDSHYAHAHWTGMRVQQGGIGQVDFTMVSDLRQRISSAYQVLHAEKQVAYRATVIIDKNKIIRHQSVNDLPLGRDINEIIRLIDALQHADEHGEVCPVSWQKGQASLKESHESLINYLEQREDVSV